MISMQSQILRYFENTQSAIWCPGLVSSIIHKSGRYELLEDNYTTASVISNRTITPVAILPIPNFSTLKLEFLCETHARLFKRQEVRQIDIDQFNAPDIIKRVSVALHLIAISPQLLGAVETLAKSIHIIQAEPGFDVSFTDPALPFSIFISIPADNNYPDFRLAEAIIHESMHLQLSIIEKEICLIQDDRPQHYSPWKKMLRPASGIMHALYVFTAIKQWLDILANTSDEHKYARYRIGEIQEEISLLDCKSCYTSLSESGKVLFDNMISSLTS